MSKRRHGDAAVARALGLGLVASAVILLFGLAWPGWVARQARRLGEGYAAPPAFGLVLGGTTLALAVIITLGLLFGAF